MKRFFIFWILTLPLMLVMVDFAVSNLEAVPVGLWPFQAPFSMPLSVLIFGGLFLGLLIGSLATWLSAGDTRRSARRARRRVAELEREAARLRQERDRAATAEVTPADNGKPGLPAPAMGAPTFEPKRRSALGR